MLEKVFSLYEKYFKSNTQKKSDVIAEEAIDESLSSEDIIPFAKEEREILLTIVGLSHYFGSKPFETIKRVHLIKEPGNKYDKSAVAVICDRVGKCGYIANSEHTIKQGTVSASTFSKCIDRNCTAEILWYEDSFAICRLNDINSFEMAYSYGVLALKNGDIDTAVDMFEILCENVPDIRFIQRLCECYINKKDYKSAQKYIGKAQIIDKDNQITKRNS